MENAEKNYLIYSYEVEDNVYVGLTKNLENRDKEHRKKKSPDRICRFCMSRGIRVPDPIILEEDLTSIEAQSKEADWIEYYKSKNYNIINKMKCGVYVSSLGGINSEHISLENKYKEKKSIKFSYTYDECFLLAKECSTINEFKIKNRRAFNVSIGYGWIKDYDWFKEEKNRPVKQEEIIYEKYLEHAKKCNTKTEFSIRFRPYYIWGLNNGYNDSIFKKSTKTPYNKKYDKEFGYLPIEDIKERLSKYTTRTELYHDNYGFYEFCRYYGYLKFIQKKKKEENGKIICKDINDVNNDHLTQIKGYRNLFLDIENCKVYKKLKSKIHELPSCLNSMNLICFDVVSTNNGRRLTPYHKLLRIAKGESECNFANYKDGDYSNISQDNIEFGYFEKLGSHQVYPYFDFYINEMGQIYDIKTETVSYGEKRKEGYFFKGLNMANVVANLFISNIGYDKNINIIHKNEDIYDNKKTNLILPYCEKSCLKIEEEDETNKIYVIDEYGRQLLIGSIKIWSVIKSIKTYITERLKTEPNISDWIEDFKENKYQEFLNTDIKLINEKKRVESSGCYWHAARDCWKSKIWYGDKEWSLGYFKTFEEGKFLYEEACIAIKYNVFETWYGMIEKEREKIKKIFN